MMTIFSHSFKSSPKSFLSPLATCVCSKQTQQNREIEIKRETKFLLINLLFSINQNNILL